jgi:hypothetical protein
MEGTVDLANWRMRKEPYQTTEGGSARDAGHWTLVMVSSDGLRRYGKRQRSPPDGQITADNQNGVKPGLKK